jgi:hypothetical protein
MWRTAALIGTALRGVRILHVEAPIGYEFRGEDGPGHLQKPAAATESTPTNTLFSSLRSRPSRRPHRYWGQSSIRPAKTI